MGNGKLTYVNVGPGGTFRKSGAVQTVPADVDAIMEHLETSRKTRLVIHFHGGLVKEASGMEVAEKMAPVYESDTTHPVSFVWETGLLETVWRNLDEVTSTDLFKKVRDYVVKYALKKLGLPGAKGEGPAISEQQIADELERLDAFERFEDGARGGAALWSEDELDELQAEVEAEVEEDLEMDDDLPRVLKDPESRKHLADRELLDQADEEEAKGLGTWIAVAKAVGEIVYRVVRRYIRKRDHGFYPTVVEEVLNKLYVGKAGDFVWGSMKKAAANMWLPNDGLLGEDRHAGTYFLEKLVELKANRPELSVDLVGHSAGSVAICEMFRAAETTAPSFKARAIFLLAPACTIDLFLEQIVDHPDRFETLRMFTMRDDYECKDRLVKAVYIRSLLYFVSGVCEPDDDHDKPLLGMQRYLSGQPPYDGENFGKLRSFFDADRIVMSNSEVIDPGAEEGRRSTSETHGGFDDDPATRESLRCLVLP